MATPKKPVAATRPAKQTAAASKKTASTPVRGKTLPNKGKLPKT